MKRAAPALLALLAVLAPKLAEAIPDLRKPSPAGPVVLYRDHAKPERFYFGPGDIVLATERDGKPRLRFIQMRYVGTETYGDPGESGSLSTLMLKMRMKGPSSHELGALRRALGRALGTTRIELRPLPITRFDVVLAYASVDAAGAVDGDTQVLEGGHVEADDDQAGRSGQDGYWSERTFSLSLGEETSQLFWNALHKGELVLSLAYTFYTEGVTGEDQPIVTITGIPREMEEELRESVGLPEAEDRSLGDILLSGEIPEPDELRALFDNLTPEEDVSPHSRMVKAGATAIRVDAARWPDLFQRIDFNEQAPPGYARLKIYCYDFKNSLRPELVYKKIEIVAESVGGRTVPLATKFLSSQPDLYARTVRFPVAVLVDRPFRYRVSTGARDGRVEVGPWQERDSWSRILDVTSGAAELDPEAPTEAEEEG